MKAVVIFVIGVLYTFPGFAEADFNICLYDPVRKRVVPVAVYRPVQEGNNTKVIVFSYGYDGNKNSRSNQSYAYLTRFLAEKGFYVISIQHELSDDPLLAMDGDFMETRMSNWKRGEENILFIVREFKRLKPYLKWDGLILIGHSNGGDITMLCATEYPELIGKAISLDHRRMPMPRAENPRLYTLRGCDYDADAGVLPDEREQRVFGITVLKLDGITHSDMGEKGTRDQHDVIKRYVYGFIR